MSIYATLWQLKFPRYGDGHTGCDWIAVMAQGVPAHLGAASPGAVTRGSGAASARPSLNYATFSMKRRAASSASLTTLRS
jgi:hypothetical protein